MYQLRDYQQDAVNAALEWITTSVEACLLELATGAGKSLIVANIARAINQKSGKKILCMAPSKELVEQNGQKYKDYGYDCSFFGGGLGKSLRHDVIFGTPDTIKNHLAQFGSEFAAVIYDEAHRITPSVKKIIESMKSANPQLRVIGMTATPYRLNDGYIFQYDEYNKPVPSDQTKNPFFHTLVYRITAPELIAMGFLTQPHSDPNHAASYDTSGITRHTQAAYEKAFEGKGRKTAEIICDIVGHAHNRMGVMIFAATTAHARECAESLPPELTRCVFGDTPNKEREQIISDFKARRFKYLVNVSVLTTGFDAAHVDLVAILRATESASLLQQIIGRGMRIHDQKTDCLILDYAENIERHQLESDLFTPIIQARHTKQGVPMEVPCEQCHTINQFASRPNPEETPIDEQGYFCDLEGHRIKIDEQDYPAHFGRRCFGYQMKQGRAERCENRWSFKSCPECEFENDIAARFCKGCKCELVDPNAHLVLQFHKMKADPYQMTTDEVRSLHIQKHLSMGGNNTIKASYVTDFAKFDVWYQPESTVPKFRSQYEAFSKAFYNGRVAPDIDTFIDHIDKGQTPSTITYIRTKGKKYWNILGYNQEIDVEPSIK